MPRRRRRRARGSGPTGTPDQIANAMLSRLLATHTVLSTAQLVELQQTLKRSLDAFLSRGPESIGTIIRKARRRTLRDNGD